MSLVWEPSPDRKRDRGRVLPFVFQVRPGATPTSEGAQEQESAAANAKVTDATSSDKPAKILRMRY